MYRKLSAHFIFPGGSNPIKNGIIIIDEKGTIVDIIDSGVIKESERLEFYDGIIIPGLINARFHSSPSEFIPKVLGEPYIVDEPVNQLDVLVGNLYSITLKMQMIMARNGGVAVSVTSKEDCSPEGDHFTFVICAKADLKRAKGLPDLDLLKTSGKRIALGTEDKESNASFSILEEMKVLQLAFPHISLLDLIDFGTINGAKSLGLDSEYGSIEIGKRPGLNLLEQVDLKHMRLTSSSKLTVLDHPFLHHRN